MTFRRLLERFGTAAAALRALPTSSAAAAAAVQICPVAEAEAELTAIEALQLPGWSFSAITAYPPPLAAVEDTASFALIGDARLLARPAIAVVGSRNASLNGRRMAFGIARDLGLAGFVIVSGMAQGIDAEAHQARSMPVPSPCWREASTSTIRRKTR
ncbi:MAG: DNA-processing protein DprA [Rhodospirillales bacterium]